MNINIYIKRKIKLIKDFDIKLTNEDIRYMYSLKTEHEVDAFARNKIGICTIF